jgi:hypothetical protein
MRFFSYFCLKNLMDIALLPFEYASASLLLAQTLLMQQHGPYDVSMCTVY